MGNDKKIVVRFYRNSNGNEPVRSWLLKLSKEDKLTIGSDIKTVEFGWPVGLPVCKSMGSGLWEVRSTLKNRIARILFCIEADSMWLLHGFIKKQQKTPKADISIAKERMDKLRKYLKDNK
ncbi:MAG: type II toxin-antitoxin system RelE/ParE family toxin [Sedimentisphaeraceae bacterium JB056]